ncbi:diguanylate cyclase [Shewanella electrodiphila]|uniref:diguanylate cyclase n=1 Tax=Shewanella electrodiphila TaxID=934143 RepID=A0ABT0KKQ4_9GAMM|nr:diguanylate cyclase [Shewanella electrodiphila]MCL1044406.1 diguanylate cyclase [Shewanella electrodiphila]
MNNKSFNSQHLVFALVLGVIGFIINCYPIPIFANVQLVLGNTFTIISAVILGPGYALITALLSASGLMFTWDSPHVYLIFGVEALFIGYSRRKGVYPLYGSALYWLTIGMPLTYLYMTTFSDLPDSHMLFAIIKQSINGLIYASLGSLLIVLIPKLWSINGQGTPKARRSFNGQVTYFMTLMLTLCLLISALTFNYLFLAKQQTLLQRNLTDTTVHLSSATEQYIENHKKVIENAANFLSLANSNADSWQPMISKLHSNYPSFITMLIANNDAKVVAGSPGAMMLDENNQLKDMSIKDRDYFIESFHNRRLFVSSVFQGRGFGNDSIVAISAPFYSDNNKIHVTGIIEGSLDLRFFSSIDNKNTFGDKEMLILVDENNHIIYATPELELTEHQEFQYSDDKGNYHTALDVIKISNFESTSPDHVYAKKQLKNGWQLYVLQPLSPLLKTAETQMLGTFILLIISIILTSLISRKVCKLLTAPLEIVANQFGEMSNEELKSQVVDENSSKEVFNLYQRLTSSKRALLKHQLELEETVAIRTDELEQANQKLLALVEEDPLTGLKNRRYAEDKFDALLDFCLRGEHAITIVILDLDFFKKVNDTYGHLAGDECLRVVSTLLQNEFKRDTDIVSRYGGEEFLLILPLSNALKIEQHLNNFKQKLSELVITSPTDNQQFSVTTSIGAITANASFSADIDVWIKVADDNLYAAKEQGRNKVIINVVNDDTIEQKV